MQEATFIKLLSGQKDDLKQIIEENGVVIRGVIRAEIDPINSTLHDLIIADEKRNAKIEVLQTETRPTRWIYRNPGKAAIAVFITLMLSAFAYHKIDMARSVENISGVIIRSDEVTVVERKAIE